jgi:hypothetical protein
MTVAILALTPDDYDAAYALWCDTPGIGLSEAESREGIGSFLGRNPGLSLVARGPEGLLGTVLCGQDGHRGTCTTGPSPRRSGAGASAGSWSKRAWRS